MKPQIGAIVHYEGQGKTYPAIITEVKEDGICALCVFKEASTQFLPVVYFSANREPGCWSPMAQEKSIVSEVAIDDDFEFSVETESQRIKRLKEKKAKKKK